MILHPSLTLDRIMRAVRRSSFQDDYAGFCIVCGRKAKQNCEPDAREYPCEYRSCKQSLTVYGAEELLLEVAP